MKTESDIRSALKNTRYYMDQVIQLAHDQFDYDVEHYDLWEDDGQKRMELLCILAEIAQNVCSRCHHMEGIIERAMKLETPRMQLLEESEV